MHCCIHGMFCTFDTYARHLDGKGGCIDPWELQPVMRKLAHRSDATRTRIWTYNRAGDNGYLLDNIDGGATEIQSSPRRATPPTRRRAA